MRSVRPGLRTAGSAPLLVLALVAGGCSAPAPPPGAAGPLEAAQEFSTAVQKGDTATAWSLLSPATRSAADALAATARASRGGAEPESGKQMLFSSALPQGPSAAKLLDEKGDEAHVAVGAARYRVVRQGGRWLIELELGARDAGQQR